MNQLHFQYNKSRIHTQVKTNKYSVVHRYFTLTNVLGQHFWQKQGKCRHCGPWHKIQQQQATTITHMLQSVAYVDDRHTIPCLRHIAHPLRWGTDAYTASIYLLSIFILRKIYGAPWSYQTALQHQCRWWAFLYFLSKRVGKNVCHSMCQSPH